MMKSASWAIEGQKKCIPLGVSALKFRLDLPKNLRATALDNEVAVVYALTADFEQTGLNPNERLHALVGYIRVYSLPYIHRNILGAGLSSVDNLLVYDLKGAFQGKLMLMLTIPSCIVPTKSQLDIDVFIQCESIRNKFKLLEIFPVLFQCTFYLHQKPKKHIRAIIYLRDQSRSNFARRKKEIRHSFQMNVGDILPTTRDNDKIGKNCLQVFYVLALAVKHEHAKDYRIITRHPMVIVHQENYKNKIKNEKRADRMSQDIKETADSRIKMSLDFKEMADQKIVEINYQIMKLLSITRSDALVFLSRFRPQFESILPLMRDFTSKLVSTLFLMPMGTDYEDPEEWILIKNWMEIFRAELIPQLLASTSVEHLKEIFKNSTINFFKPWHVRKSLTRGPYIAYSNILRTVIWQMTEIIQCILSEMYPVAMEDKKLQCAVSEKECPVSFLACKLWFGWKSEPVVRKLKPIHVKTFTDECSLKEILRPLSPTGMSNPQLLPIDFIFEWVTAFFTPTMVVDSELESSTAVDPDFASTNVSANTETDNLNSEATSEITSKIIDSSTILDTSNDKLSEHKPKTYSAIRNKVHSYRSHNVSHYQLHQTEQVHPAIDSGSTSSHSRDVSQTSDIFTELNAAASSAGNNNPSCLDQLGKVEENTSDKAVGAGVSINLPDNTSDKAVGAGVSINLPDNTSDKAVGAGVSINLPDNTSDKAVGAGVSINSPDNTSDKAVGAGVSINLPDNTSDKAVSAGVSINLPDNTSDKAVGAGVSINLPDNTSDKAVGAGVSINLPDNTSDKAVSAGVSINLPDNTSDKAVGAGVSINLPDNTSDKAVGAGVSINLPDNTSDKAVGAGVSINLPDNTRKFKKAVRCKRQPDARKALYIMKSNKRKWAIKFPNSIGSSKSFHKLHVEQLNSVSTDEISALSNSVEPSDAATESSDQRCNLATVQFNTNVTYHVNKATQLVHEDIVRTVHVSSHLVSSKFNNSKTLNINSNDVLIVPANIDIPINPSNSDVPINPSNSDVPINPSNSDVPINPSNSDVPINPSNSDVPINPSNSDVPINPSNSDVPINPSNSDVPINPSNSDVPINPSNSDVPINPSNSDVPINPSNSDVPINPSNSDVPINPSNSDVPINPSNSDVPINPSNSDVPINPADSQPPKSPASNVPTFIPEIYTSPVLTNNVQTISSCSDLRLLPENISSLPNKVHSIYSTLLTSHSINDNDIPDSSYQDFFSAQTDSASENFPSLKLEEELNFVKSQNLPTSLACVTLITSTCSLASQLINIPCSEIKDSPDKSCTSFPSKHLVDISQINTCDMNGTNHTVSTIKQPSKYATDKLEKVSPITSGKKFRIADRFWLLSKKSNSLTKTCTSAVDQEQKHVQEIPESKGINTDVSNDIETKFHKRILSEGCTYDGKSLDAISKTGPVFTSEKIKADSVHVQEIPESKGINTDVSDEIKTKFHKRILFEGCTYDGKSLDAISKTGPVFTSEETKADSASQKWNVQYEHQNVDTMEYKTYNIQRVQSCIKQDKPATSKYQHESAGRQYNHLLPVSMSSNKTATKPPDFSYQLFPESHNKPENPTAEPSKLYKPDPKAVSRSRRHLKPKPIYKPHLVVVEQKAIPILVYEPGKPSQQPLSYQSQRSHKHLIHPVIPSHHLSHPDKEYHKTLIHPLKKHNKQLAQVKANQKTKPEVKPPVTFSETFDSQVVPPIKCTNLKESTLPLLNESSTEINETAESKSFSQGPFRVPHFEKNEEVLWEKNIVYNMNLQHTGIWSHGMHIWASNFNYGDAQSIFSKPSLSDPPEWNIPKVKSSLNPAAPSFTIGQESHCTTHQISASENVLKKLEGELKHFLNSRNITSLSPTSQNAEKKNLQHRFSRQMTPPNFINGMGANFFIPQHQHYFSNELLPDSCWSFPNYSHVSSSIFCQDVQDSVYPYTEEFITEPFQTYSEWLHNSSGQFQANYMQYLTDFNQYIMPPPLHNNFCSGQLAFTGLPSSRYQRNFILPYARNF